MPKRTDILAVAPSLRPFGPTLSRAGEREVVRHMANRDAEGAHVNA